MPADTNHGNPWFIVAAGQAVLAAGIANIAAPEVRVGDWVFCSYFTIGATPGSLGGQIIADGQVIVNSSAGLGDSNTFNWQVIRPK